MSQEGGMLWCRVRRDSVDALNDSERLASEDLEDTRTSHVLGVYSRP